MLRPLALDSAHLLLLTALDLSCRAKVTEGALVSPSAPVDLLEVVRAGLALVLDMGRLHLRELSRVGAGLHDARRRTPALDLLLRQRRDSRVRDVEMDEGVLLRWPVRPFDCGLGLNLNRQNADRMDLSADVPRLGLNLGGLSLSGVDIGDVVRL